MTIRAKPLLSEGIDEFVRQLAVAGLPTEDVRERGKKFFTISDGAGLVGYGGWEGHGNDRLLRSLVIVSERRGQGLGATALSLIEERAQQSGTRRLHLLTTTAAAFFQLRGYKKTSRSVAPSAIRLSAEFSQLCPDSATYMIKTLDGRSH